MKKLLVLLLFIASHFAMAQEESTDPCVQNIEIAQQRYDEGRIQDIQPLLKDCLAAGNFDKAQKSQALRLLTLSYIFLEDESQAEATMLNLLQTNHEFQVNAAIDPTEFINLHDQFRYKPLFNVGVRYITNLAQPIVKELNSTLSLNGEYPVYSYQLGYVGIGLNFEYEFYKDFFIYPEITFKTMSISRSGSQEGFLPSTTEPYLMEIENFEDQNWLSLPISAKYIIHLKSSPKLKFYVNLGGSIDYLLGATRPSDGSTLNTTGAPEVGFNINSADDKNRLNFGIFGGGGITYKIGEGFVSLEGRYLHSFTNLTIADNTLNPSDSRQINTGVQDDVYSLNYVAISLGYTLHIYVPKKLR
jgi:hypothetical protein